MNDPWEEWVNKARKSEAYMRERERIGFERGAAAQREADVALVCGWVDVALVCGWVDVALVCGWVDAATYLAAQPLVVDDDDEVNEVAP